MDDQNTARLEGDAACCPDHGEWHVQTGAARSSGWAEQPTREEFGSACGGTAEVGVDLRHGQASSATTDRPGIGSIPHWLWRFSGYGGQHSDLPSRCLPTD